MMPGMTMQEICDAITEAFTEAELTMALQYLMDANLDNLVSGNRGFQFRVFELVKWADRDGRSVELVQALAKSRPRNPKLRAVSRKYGLSIPVSVENAGATVANDPTSSADGALQALEDLHAGPRGSGSEEDAWFLGTRLLAEEYVRRDRADEFGRVAPAAQCGSIGEGFLFGIGKNGHRHVGGEGARGDAIDGDAEGPEVDGTGPGQSADRGFGGAVGVASFLGHFPHDARNVHDPPPAPRFHLRSQCPRQGHDRRQIHFENAIQHFIQIEGRCDEFRRIA